MSLDHSVFPAPTIVCNSSINRIICPFDFSTVSKTFFNFSSNAPRYCVQAIISLTRSSNIFLSLSVSGTSHFTILCASHSTRAVFPTHGSHTNTGLFFILRERICIMRRISSSRQMIGSIFPFAASHVISIANSPIVLSISSRFSASSENMVCPL